MKQTPFYDPEKTFEDNYKNGPFGPLADGEIYQDIGEPEYDFFEHKVYLPFGIAAGPLYNGRFIKGALDKGFDLVVHKTVRSALFPSNPFPNILGLPDIKGNLTIEHAQEGIVADNIYKEPLNILNSFNNPSFDPEVWQKDLRMVLSYLRKGQVLICSYEALPNADYEAYINDWVKCAMLIKETGVDIIEMNTSCPNAGKTGLLCFDIERMRTIIKRVKEAIGDTKLIIKLAYFQDKELLEKLIESTGNIADGYAVINTIQSKIVDEKGDLKLTGGRIWAGASGDSIRWLGLEMVKNMNTLRNKHNMKFKIIGMGGVFNAEHYKMYKEIGADAVMSVTGVLWNPYLAQEIKQKYAKI